MLTDPLGKENPFGDHILAQFIFLQRIKLAKKSKSNTAIYEDCMKKKRSNGLEAEARLSKANA